MSYAHSSPRVRNAGFSPSSRSTACLEEVEITKEQVLELHSYLEDQGIDVVDADGRPAKSDGGGIEAARPSRPPIPVPTSARRRPSI